MPERPWVKWPDPCACKPGTEAEGWHERRCAACNQVESNQWKQAMALLPSIVERLRSQR